MYIYIYGHGVYPLSDDARLLWSRVYPFKDPWRWDFVWFPLSCLQNIISYYEIDYHTEITHYPKTVHPGVASQLHNITCLTPAAAVLGDRSQARNIFIRNKRDD